MASVSSLISVLIILSFLVCFSLLLQLYRSYPLPWKVDHLHCSLSRKLWPQVWFVGMVPYLLLAWFLHMALASMSYLNHSPATQEELLSAPQCVRLSQSSEKYQGERRKCLLNIVEHIAL